MRVPFRITTAALTIVSHPLRPTTSGHFISWTRHGLLKEFRRDNVRFDLIRQVYNANMRHVESGYADGRSITITSIGATLYNAILSKAVESKGQVVEQVRAAVDALHAQGIAHCDICCENVFVKEDGEVILGDLQHCTELQHRPPAQAKRMYGNPDTALELDENQFVRFVEELNSYF